MIAFDGKCETCARPMTHEPDEHLCHYCRESNTLRKERNAARAEVEHRPLAVVAADGSMTLRWPDARIEIYESECVLVIDDDFRNFDSAGGALAHLEQFRAALAPAKDES